MIMAVDYFKYVEFNGGVHFHCFRRKSLFRQIWSKKSKTSVSAEI